VNIESLFRFCGYLSDYPTLYRGWHIPHRGVLVEVDEISRTQRQEAGQIQERPHQQQKEEPTTARAATDGEIKEAEPGEIKKPAQQHRKR